MVASARKPTLSPAFQFYPNDFLGDPRVQVMSTTEIGAYWLLIMACWNDPTGLPNDMRRLGGIARMKEPQFDRMWSHVLHECFELKGDRWFHRRVEKERKKQSEFRQQQKDKADKRWQSHGNAMAMPGTGTRHASGNALLSSSSSSSSSSKKIIDQRFERFWSEYPRKVAKDAALKEWLKSSPDDELTDRIIASVRRHKASQQWQKDEGQFIPHARTWLYQKRWQDEADEAATPLLKTTAHSDNVQRYLNAKWGE